MRRGLVPTRGQLLCFVVELVSAWITLVVLVGAFVGLGIEALGYFVFAAD